MIPSVFEYMPDLAPVLFEKVATLHSRNADPEVVAPDVPAEPRVDPQLQKPPTHPYMTGLKQLLPIGAGLATGYVAGAGLPYLADKYVFKSPNSPGYYHALGGISAVAGGIGGLAATILSQARQAEADRANQEYKDHFARRAGDRSNPSVQPPQVRT